MKKVFVVDSNLFSASIFEQHLKNLAFTDISLFTNAEDCISRLQEMPDIILIDYHLGSVKGTDLLKIIKQVNPHIYVILITHTSNINEAVVSLKFGSFDYLIKGVNEANQLEFLIKRINTTTASLEMYSSFHHFKYADLAK